MRLDTDLKRPCAILKYVMTKQSHCHNARCKRAHEQCSFIMQDNFTYSACKSKNAQCSLEGVIRRLLENRS